MLILKATGAVAFSIAQNNGKGGETNNPSCTHVHIIPQDMPIKQQCGQRRGIPV